MTAQISEILIWDGQKLALSFCPPLPEGHPNLSELDVKDIKKIKAEDSLILSTACWRGYIGTWEIRNNQFYLVDIQGRYKMTSETPLLADWFSGVLRVPQGKILHHINMGFASVYEQETHIKIETGKVIKLQVVDNRNKDFNTLELGWKNLPGFENRFDGDEEM